MLAETKEKAAFRGNTCGEVLYYQRRSQFTGKGSKSPHYSALDDFGDDRNSTIFIEYRLFHR
jgi:hypothetical protein